MNFDFQAMKPIIQADMDRILETYPTDMSAIRDLVPEGGDPYVRKLTIIEAAAEQCPVHLFDHYPFAFEVDMGEPREVCYVGLGNLCPQKSGADLSHMERMRDILNETALGYMSSYTDPLHRTLDHRRLLSIGFRGVYEECVEYNRTETDPRKKAYREMVMRICLAVQKMGLRLRDKARKRLNHPADEDTVYNMRRIADSVNTPWEAPVTLFDALNTILCTTLWISGLDGVEMNAYGQLDLLAEPYYHRDLEAGRVTRSEAEFLIRCFLHKTDMHCHFDNTRKTYDNGVSVMIGGCDEEGQPVYNEITDMILDAYRDNPLINPKLNARACTASPQAYLLRLAELMCSGRNNLVVENDDYIIPMFQRMGLQIRDARGYVGNGCQEVICPNQVHSRAFIYLNLPLVLLHTLKYARSDETLPESLKQLYAGGRFCREDFDRIYDAFFQNLHALIQSIALAVAPGERQHALINPEPMMSAFTADCIARGLDAAEGGARYYHKTLALVGFGTLCDSLLSLKAACARGEAETLIQAAESDFSGQETLRAALKNSDHRFGHSEAADRFAAKLAQDLSEVSRDIRNAQGIRWGTSLFTYYFFRHFGVRTPATPDGRLGGDTLSRQMNMAMPPELTQAARSMAVLTEAPFQDVGMLDIALPRTLVHDPRMQEALSAYIRTCMGWKIPVLQANVADRESMIEERDHKGTHPDLIVRVCGFSAVFGQIDPDMQNEIINRTAV